MTVLIRPEQVTLSGSMDSSVDGTVDGTVTEISYHGHDALVTVDISGTEVVRARSSGAMAPVPGDKVALGVDGPVTAWPKQSSALLVPGA